MTRVARPGEFLAEQDGPIPFDVPEGGRAAFAPVALFLGRGDSPIEVAVVTARRRPNVSDVRTLWKRRQGGRAAPVLLVVLYEAPDGAKAALCGPKGDEPPVEAELDRAHAERIARVALSEPHKEAATRFVVSALAEAESELPGITNAGLLATHELKTGVPQRTDWTVMTEWGKRVLDQRGRDLIRSLGFKIDPLGTSASVLRIEDGGVRTAIAVFLEEDETPEGHSTRFGGTSAASYALAKADAESLPYVLLTRGSQIRLYVTDPNVGVGRRGRAETFVDANLTLLPDDLAGYVPLLFGAEALRPGGAFTHILERSHDFSTGLGERLRDRVYADVVPVLARAVAGGYDGTADAPTEQDLADLYETTMVILFRTLFVAYAEDRDLLPYRSNGLYQRTALKTLARDLAEKANAETFDPDPAATSYWDQLQGLWKAIHGGDRDKGVPAYDGGMFSSDPSINPVGARIASLELSNADIGPALLSLLVDESTDGLHGPVDFRSLSVREFGTIYEGLLESSLSVASVDLTIDPQGTYVPAADGDDVLVRSGDIYLHNRSGARKATGSYFTKPFAVEHLLDHALEPAISAHLTRIESLLDAGEEHEAARAFFDFRVADIAMGSGHFLVAAVDHIEPRFSTFLADHPIPGVLQELDRLRGKAQEHLGELATEEIEQASLLRRQIARRCVYGVDINGIAVDLARLAVWIHTFVKGLPLSFLDHNLVQGNSLTGIGTLDEALDILVPDTGRTSTPSLFADTVREWLDRASEPLRRLARVGDADAAEVAQARAAHADARAAVEPARRLFDLLVGMRLGEVDRFEEVDEAAINAHPGLGRAEARCLELQALHFPIAFPEVFTRERNGFDCILGNPPWEKVKVERHTWWTLRFPGLASLPVGRMNSEIERLTTERPDLEAAYDEQVSQADAMRAILIRGPYPDIGRGDPDLYKAFAWRFWHLVADDGTIGVVLPRSALAAAGSAMWREAVLDEGEFLDTTLLLNRTGWVFDDAEHRYTIGLVSLRKGDSLSGIVRTRGPFASREAFDRGTTRSPVEFPAADFRTWTTGAAFPLIPTVEAGDVFLKMRRHPRLDRTDGRWRARPLQELHSTADKPNMALDPESTDGLWKVYAGAGFNIWEPDTGNYYAWADPDHITEHLHRKRLRQQRTARSPYSEFPREWVTDRTTLAVRHPRIAFRRVSRATDTRTVICNLVPHHTPLTDKAPFFLWPRGDESDEAYLLGVLASVPLDWYARRVVELQVDYHVINAFPVPEPPGEDRHRSRVVEIAGRLAAVDDRYEEWADSVGVPVGSVTDPEEKDALIAELDAAVAHLYGMDEADLRVVFETFHEGWDYEDRLDAVLAHFRRLTK